MRLALPPAPAPVETATGALFGVLSLVRGRRVFHPDGLAFAAAVALLPGAPGPLGPPRTLAATARLSRGAGLPQPLPDILGLALRLHDAGGPGVDQDLLLNTTLDGPLVHHLLLPAGGFERRSFTSSLPYDAGAGLFLIGAVPVRPPRRAAGTDLGRVLELAGRGRLAFDLVSAPLEGRWGRRWARVTIGARRPDAEADALRFNPWNTVPGLRPAGPLNGLRRTAYRWSQGGRRAA